jgi:2-haloacid dehalogenase
MTADRRDFLNQITGGIVTGLLPSSPVTLAAARPRFKGLAFDAFTIFDPRPIFALAEKLFPGKGAELSNTWRTRQFEYTWLRTLSGRYTDFSQVTGDALVYAAKALKLDLSPEKHQQLLNAYLQLKAHPDAPPALEELKKAGLRLAFLSNMTPKMLAAAVQNSGLEGLFEHVLTTDAVRAYKPDPRAYQMGIDAFGLKKEEIAFVAFGGWDAAGAKSFGYPTFWVNRLDLPVEELGVVPDAIGRSLTELVHFVNT